MKRKFVYEIQEFVTPDGSHPLGGYGFGVYLDIDFARCVRNFVPDDVDFVQNKFQEHGKDWIIRKVFKNEGEFLRNPYYFVEDSLFIQSVNVPGNACDLGVDWGQIEYLSRENSLSRCLNYSPHNVDSRAQAYCLMSLFTKWVDWTKALTKFEDL